MAAVIAITKVYGEILTIFVKSRIYPSLVLRGPGGCSPPNNTAWWSSIMVREK